MNGFAGVKLSCGLSFLGGGGSGGGEGRAPLAATPMVDLGDERRSGLLLSRSGFSIGTVLWLILSSCTGGRCAV